VVKAARQKFDAGRRRYAGIVLDVFYDHVLAKNWSSYCGTPLQEFIQEFYRALAVHRALLPERLAAIVPMIVQQDWLGSYRELAGFETTVRRISSRLSRNGDLMRDGLLDVRDNYEFLCDGFDEFFPELIRFAEDQRALMQISGS
jgi:acyl carrier protein phosphodiesterase